MVACASTLKQPGTSTASPVPAPAAWLLLGARHSGDLVGHTRVTHGACLQVYFLYKATDKHHPEKEALEKAQQQLAVRQAEESAKAKANAGNGAPPEPAPAPQR
jgi:hypothetical protein